MLVIVKNQGEITMALNSLKISSSASNEGQWLDIGTMSFRVKRANANIAEKIRQFKSKNIAEDSAALNKFVFSELVTDWKGVTESKLQNYIISNQFYDSEGWFDVAGIQFKMKRATLQDFVDIQSVQAGNAKTRKSIRTLILGWENFKFSDDDKECVEYTPSVASDILGKEEWAEALSQILDNSYDSSLYALSGLSDEEIGYNHFSVQKYFVDVDKNDITERVIQFSRTNENFFEEEVKENVKAVKK